MVDLVVVYLAVLVELAAHHIRVGFLVGGKVDPSVLVFRFDALDQAVLVQVLQTGPKDLLVHAGLVFEVVLGHTFAFGVENQLVNNLVVGVDLVEAAADIGVLVAVRNLTFRGLPHSQAALALEFVEQADSLDLRERSYLGCF